MTDQVCMPSARAPAAPGVVAPWSTYRAKHVATKDPRADVGHATSREVVADAGFATFATVRLLEGAGVEEPPMQPLAADAERTLQ